jgi:hypothetical protein
MSELEHAHQHAHDHHHACANLFGCGDEKGTGIIRDDINDAAFDSSASDRLPSISRPLMAPCRPVAAGAGSSCRRAGAARFWLMRSISAVSYWSSNLSGSKRPDFWFTMCLARSRSSATELTEPPRPRGSARSQLRIAAVHEGRGPTAAQLYSTLYRWPVGFRRTSATVLPSGASVAAAGWERNLLGWC